jgi:hypothetical protein
MAPKKKARRTFRRAKRAYRRATQRRSVFGTSVGSAMGALPFVTADPNTGYSVADYLQAAWTEKDPSQLGNIPGALVGGTLAALPQMAELGVILAGEGWAARKFGLSNKTRISKKWSIL